MVNSDTKIFLFGAGSQIMRNSFKNYKDHEVVGFSKFTKLNTISEYKCYRYKGLKTFKHNFNKNNPKKSVLIFAQTNTNSKLIINKNKKDFINEFNFNFIDSHEIIKFVLPTLIKNKWGRLIFLGSSRALRTDIGLSSYSVVKYSSLAYCKTLSREYGKFGITSNYLSLGLFKSPLLNKVKKNDLDNILKNTDTKDIGDYNSVKNAINFIISSKYVTGSIIKIDGGYN